ncbi:DUF7558 family protein [Halobacterium hubeiense]
MRRSDAEAVAVRSRSTLCARDSLVGLATYWTRDREEHLVATPAE